MSFNLHTIKLERIVKQSLEKQTAQPKVQRNKIYPGDSYCPRRSILYTQAAGTETSSEVLRSTFYFESGKAIHKVIALSLGNLVMAQELRITNEHIGPPKLSPINGYIDYVIRLSNQYFVLEIKTCSRVPKDPNPWHIAQASVYALLTGIRKAIVLYVTRNDYSVKAFAITEYDIEKAAERLATAHVYANESLLPKRLEDKADCKYCHFESFCYSDKYTYFDSDELKAAVLSKKGDLLAGMDESLKELKKIVVAMAAAEEKESESVK